MNLEVSSRSSRQKMVFLAVIMAMTAAKTDGKHNAFKAIFNFGDSNSDTGGFYAAFPSERLPFGMTYFNKPVGRATDGRVIVDFLGTHSWFISLKFIYYPVKEITKTRWGWLSWWSGRVL